MLLDANSALRTSAVIFLWSIFSAFAKAFETVCYHPTHHEPPNIADCRTIVDHFDQLSHRSPWRFDAWIFGRKIPTIPPRMHRLPYRWREQPGLKCTFNMFADSDEPDTIYLGDIYGAMTRVLHQCMSGPRHMEGRSVVIQGGRVNLEFVVPPSISALPLMDQDMETNRTNVTIGDIAAT